MNNRTNIIGIIPARMGAGKIRFPGKPLAKILGMPMVGHVYFRSKINKTLKDVYIATCDKEIEDYAKSIGIKAIMTKDTYQRCTDRTVEAMLKIEKETGKKIDIVVMIQGDEPVIFPEMIDLALEPLLKDSTIQVSNLMTPLKTEDDQEDPNTIKVVVDKNNFLLYFSRQPIPKKWRDDSWTMLKQVAIMAFSRDALLEYSKLEPTPLEKTESIDLLRFLEHGYKIKMVMENFDTHSVDIPADLPKVEKIMANDPLIKNYATQRIN